MSGGDRTTPSETVTRKPDSDVGRSGAPPAGGGHQTPEQAAITGQGSGQETGGRSDSERRSEWSGDAARSNPGIGGSSQGQSDQKASGGPRQGETVVAGHSKPERDNGRVEEAEQ